MSNTYYHYKGFVYGPVTLQKPKGINNGQFFDQSDSIEYADKVRKWRNYVLESPKYKWTGQPMEDWIEMIEGKDFKIERTFLNSAVPVTK